MYVRLVLVYCFDFWFDVFYFVYVGGWFVNVVDDFFERVVFGYFFDFGKN